MAVKFHLYFFSLNKSVYAKNLTKLHFSKHHNYGNLTQNDEPKSENLHFVILDTSTDFQVNKRTSSYQFLAEPEVAGQRS